MDSLSTKHLIVLDGDNVRPAKDVAAVDRLMKISKTKGFWEFMDEAMKIWSERHPAKWREAIIEVKNTRSGLKDKTWATTESKYMERRFLIRMPEFFNYAITILYPDFNMDRKFYNTFARRYPAFRVSDKV